MSASTQPQAPRAVASTASAGQAARVVTPQSLSVSVWDADSSNTSGVQGRVLLGGRPVQGAQVSVDDWLVPSRTDKQGTFTYPADNTIATRHVVEVVGATGATHRRPRAHRARSSRHCCVGRAASTSATSWSTSKARSGPEDTVVVTGRMTYGNGAAPPPVLLFSYELHGMITDASGKPVKGAVVTTRTNDRQYWTQSRPSGPNGGYASFLVAADTLNNDPVPMSVGVAVGDTFYAMAATDAIDFAKLKSSVLNIQLPATAGTTLVKANLNPQPVPGAIYQGLLVGVVGGRGRVIKPLQRELARRGGPVPARAPELRARRRREVLAVGPAVLLHEGRATGRGDRSQDLPEVTAGRRAAGPGDAEASRLTRS